MSQNHSSRIQLGNRVVDGNSEPYLIAEIGMNHEGSLDKAKRLIELAKEGGADAAKFQTYKASKLASKNSPSYWDLSREPTTSQRTLFEKYDRFERKDYLALAEHCRKSGIDFLSTPFDDDAVEFLKDLMPFYKIASADITTIPFLRKIGRTGKAVVLSTGASTLNEVRRAVDTLHKAGASNVALMHCILNYPTPFEEAHLNMIGGLAREFPECVIGYSDHTMVDESMMVLCTAYLKGARIIEKHFTDNKSLPGNDHYHAMDVSDLLMFKKQMVLIRKLEGQTGKVSLDSEQISRKNARRSLVLQCPIKSGERLTEPHLTYKRPGTGISPLHWNEVVGKSVKKDLEEDHLLRWSDLQLFVTTQKPKVTAVIQARMGSQRFPGKMMANLGQIPLIDWVLSRVSLARRVDEVVLAIPKGDQNDILEEKAREKMIRVFRGSEDDVLERFVETARGTATDVVIRVCADNPFIEPGVIDDLVEFYLRESPDYAFNHLNRMGNNFPDGFGAEILSRPLLEEIGEKAILPQHREHVTLYLWDHSDDYSLKTFPAKPLLARPDIRLDIDAPKDLQRLETLLEKIQKGTDSPICPKSLKAETILEFATKKTI